MSESLHEIRFPAESEKYRSARNELLEAEIELRQRIEEVAALRLWKFSDLTPEGRGTDWYPQLSYD